MLPLTITEDDIVAFARRWSKLLAAGEFQAACDLLDEPRGGGVWWTPQLLRECIEIDHYGPGTIFSRLHPEGVIYSDPDVVEMTSPSRHFGGQFGPDGYELCWDLPLNGEWSDITALFQLTRTPEGFLICLYDLHVM
jgi:hypothetical protein